MKLKKIFINDFKCIHSLELELSNVNIIVGANGSGKSSVLQGLHLACCMIRQAKKVEMSTSTVGIDELDYLPSNEYKSLSYLNQWGNKSGTPSSKVEFVFSNEGQTYSAKCELRSARNAGISISGSIDPQLTQLLRKKNDFYSAFIPGISGIPNREEGKGKKVVLKNCSFGDSNVILRNVLWLLQENDPSAISTIESWVEKVVGKVSISVNYNQETDLSIQCDVSIGGDRRPIELVGTGYLQLIQIFSYIHLFSPGLLLIDEPDTHLHPTVQEKLVRLLDEISMARNMRVLITSHSPFIVRGAPLSARIFWMDNGSLNPLSRSGIEATLGWGIFGKKLIILTEDSDITFLRYLIRQWPDLEQFISILPGAGFSNLPKPEQVLKLNETLGGTYKFLIHRDRDGLISSEIHRLRVEYSAIPGAIWITSPSDIEGYFCDSRVFSVMTGISIDDSDRCITSVLSTFEIALREELYAHRSTINAKLYKGDGGSPILSDVSEELDSTPLKGYKGKTVMTRLENAYRREGYVKDRIIGMRFPFDLAIDLKSIIEELTR